MKKLLAILIVLVMTLSTTAFAADFADVDGHWAEAAIGNAADNNLITGSAGYFFPDNNMTRAEMATIVVRAFGATADADISEFTDVATDAWYYSSVSKAVAMGAFNGADGKFNPENSITRQEAFVVLSRVFGLAINETVDVSVLDEFSDANKVADWAKADVAAIISAGYVGGSNGMLNPEANITRAEFAVVMDRLIKYYVDDASVTTIPTDGNVMIRVGGVKLDGVNTENMVVIGDGVGENDISVINSHLDKNIVVRAGKTVSLFGRYAHVKIIRPGVRVEGVLKGVNDSDTAEKIHKAYVVAGSTIASVVILGEPVMPETEDEVEEDTEEAVEEETVSEETAEVTDEK